MANLLERARNGDCLADVGIIDLHGHIGPYTFAIPDLANEGLIAVMNRLGVAQIAVSDMTAWSTDIEYGNERVLTAIRAFPDRILGYVGIWPSDHALVRNQVSYWLNQGFFGLKLHNSNGFSYMDEAYQPAYAVANERGLPMLFHTWGGEAEFTAIAQIAERYPQTSILLAHSGSANEAGYLALARKHPNVYLDLAFSASPRGLVKRLVEAVGAERITFGSDCYFFSLTQQIGKVLGADISDQDKIRILSTNARNIIAKRRAHQTS